VIDYERESERRQFRLKFMGWSLAGLTSALLVWGITAEVLADYEYSNSIESYWKLSEKASSLEVKTDYLNKFVAAVESQHLSGNDALFLRTPDNSVEQNMIALHSLQSRMNEIRGMDVQSFAYQQAIQQITAQEQGEAEHLLGVIEGRWYLEHHILLWDWIDAVKIVLLLLVGAFSVILLMVAYD
jgi:hypothetical protein